MISNAVCLLKKGQLVAFPTETVYAIGALATCSDGIEKLFAAKQRPLEKPISLLISNKKYINHWARCISKDARRLASVFWPGALTMLLNANDCVPQRISANSGRIGLRVPNHPVALALLSRLNNAIAASSANVSGDFSVTTSDDVTTVFKQHTSLMLEDHCCPIGIESTVIDMTQTTPVITRLGAITQDKIELVLKKSVQTHDIKEKTKKKYTLLIEWFHSLSDIDATKLAKSKIAVLMHKPTEDNLPSSIRLFEMPQDPLLYQKVLYSQLNQLQREKFDRIFIQDLPRGTAWKGITACLKKWSISA